jgi:hypothetical protein
MKWNAKNAGTKHDETLSQAIGTSDRFLFFPAGACDDGFLCDASLLFGFALGFPSLESSRFFGGMASIRLANLPN